MRFTNCCAQWEESENKKEGQRQRIINRTEIRNTQKSCCLIGLEKLYLNDRPFQLIAFLVTIFFVLHRHRIISIHSDTILSRITTITDIIEAAAEPYNSSSSVHQQLQQNKNVFKKVNRNANNKHSEKTRHIFCLPRAHTYIRTSTYASIK